jgi:hypothetical protein
MAFQTDQPLWYNNGVWGELGYAVPNFGNDPNTLNETIHYLTSVIGRNLSAIMHHQDVDLRCPPTINTLTRLHKLITRARTILGSRDVESGEFRMEPVHSSPAQLEFLVYPVPYFRVRNAWLKQYCGLILACLTEAYQHTDNRVAFEISTVFSGTIGQYLHRIYRLMAVELFNVPIEAAKALDFTLTQEQLASYRPESVFTSTEMIDTMPPTALVPTEDDIRILTDGIPATQLVGLSLYPSGSLAAAAAAGSTTPAVTGAVASAPASGATGSFQAAPGP